jgi:plastocyanin
MSADDTSSVSRRGFLRVATGAAAASAAAGTAAAQEGNSTNSTSTSSGNESSSGGSSGGGPTEEVAVGPGGNLTFEPAELEITPGTTVKFVWESDLHNIVPESQPEGANWEGTAGGSDKTYDTGHEYSYTFETEGDYAYYCQPHQSAGMEGTITVSADAGGSGGGSGGAPSVPDSAKTLGIASVIGMTSTLGLAYFLMRYGGDYREE